MDEFKDQQTIASIKSGIKKNWIAKKEWGEKTKKLFENDVNKITLKMNVVMMRRDKLPKSSQEYKDLDRKLTIINARLRKARNIMNGYPEEPNTIKTYEHKTIRGSATT
jgi:hypothetical protein